MQRLPLRARPLCLQHVTLVTPQDSPAQARPLLSVNHRTAAAPFCFARPLSQEVAAGLEGKRQDDGVCPALLSSGAEATRCFLFAHRAGPAALFSFDIYGVLTKPYLMTQSLVSTQSGRQSERDTERDREREAETQRC